MARRTTLRSSVDSHAYLLKGESGGGLVPEAYIPPKAVAAKLVMRGSRPKVRRAGSADVYTESRPEDVDPRGHGSSTRTIDGNCFCGTMRTRESFLAVFALAGCAAFSFWD